MDSLLGKFELSNHTVLVCMLLPFFYYMYQMHLRYRPYRMKQANIIFLTLLSAFTLAISLKIKSTASGEIPLELSLLHYVPLGLCLLLFFGHRQQQFVVGTQSTKSGQSAPLYSPSPLNREIERITWSDLIISEHLKEELNSIIRLLKDPRIAQKYGIDIPKGILLNGPPGTGKTTVAKVIASQAGLSFFALKADEVISKWVGDSEKNLSALFAAAKRHAPAVIFIDEIDSIGKQRSGAGGQEHRESFLNHLLQMLDGIVATKGIYVIAATNRADLVDAALKRPGRLNKVVDIPLPDSSGRRDLFDLYLSKVELAESIDTEILSRMTDSASPAVIKEICNQAGLNAFKRESITGNRKFLVTRTDLEMALAEFI